MKALPDSIQRLIREFNKLPGIGHKTSERFVYHLLRQPREEIDAMGHALQEVRDNIKRCSICSTYTEEDTCTICSDPGRDRSVICVVAEPRDVIALEKTGEFRGLYHVLGGVIDHANGVGPAQLRMDELVERTTDGITEVIIATNPDMEGETTALYIAHQLKPNGVRVTRIARGLPIGANIEFADEVTLGNALSGRREM